ncbi:MAG: hypothetical protein WCL06_13920 [Bacteroidota bacterium]
MKNCLYCNAVFEGGNRHMKFCTSDCRISYNNEENKKRQRRARALNPIKSTKAFFKAQQSEKIHPTNDSDSNNYDKEDGFTTICVGCNFKFVATDPRQKYCSETCHKVSMIKERKLQKKLSKGKGKYD